MKNYLLLLVLFIQITIPAPSKGNEYKHKNKIGISYNHNYILLTYMPEIINTPEGLTIMNTILKKFNNYYDNEWVKKVKRQRRIYIDKEKKDLRSINHPEDQIALYEKFLLNEASKLPPYRETAQDALAFNTFMMNNFDDYTVVDGRPVFKTESNRITYNKFIKKLQQHVLNNFYIRGEFYSVKTMNKAIANQKKEVGFIDLDTWRKYK